MKSFIITVFIVFYHSFVHVFGGCSPICQHLNFPLKLMNKHQQCVRNTIDLMNIL